MFSMSWFGIPSSDPQGPGPDPSYGNGEWGSGCVATNNPATCSTCILKGAGDVCVQTGSPQRDLASRRRMLAGIYSASAKDTEGVRRVDLMLSNVRRSCDDGAKIDAWSTQMNGTRDTPLHPDNPACTTCGISYDATQSFLAEADNAGMQGVIIPGDDSTFYFHFGSDVGLGTCDDSADNPKQNCIDALTQDFTDMANMSVAHPSALKLNGKPVLYIYMDPLYLTSAQWISLLGNARNASGHDFYLVASSQNPTAASYLAAFDGISPWVQVDWNNYTGSTVREHAANWAAGLHGSLYSALASYPGRVVFGAATPGFDDYTENWGTCTERQLPPGDPRDPDVLLGEFDYFHAQGTRGLIMETWDDWTEGTHFEPDVAGGTSMLVSLRDQLGSLFGEAPDPSGDQRLTNRWNAYGQARNCNGGSAATPPTTTLMCTGGDGGSQDAGSCATEQFDETSNDVVGGWSSSNVDLFADVNGDGKDDLLILWDNGGTAFVQVSLSDGSSFTQVSNGALAPWNTATQSFVGDVNGDGKKDLIQIFPNGTSTEAQVWESNGVSFASVSNAAVGGWDPTYIDLLMDVNGDGKDDLVILWNNGSTMAQVTLSNGTAFTVASNDSLDTVWNVSDRFLVGDINGDGRKDLVRVYANGNSASAQVFLSNGTAFAEASDTVIGGWSAAWVNLLADINDDGKDDLVILWDNVGTTTAQVNVSNGTAFPPTSNHTTGVAWNPANRYFTADTNGDGMTDLVTLWPNGTSAYAQVALSTGTSFVQASNGSVGGYNSAWVDAVRDVSGDGHADLVVLWQDTTQPAGRDARAQVSERTCN
jgi:hypothetical protein